MRTGLDIILDGEGISTGGIEIVDPLDLFVQEITVLFDTLKTEVLFQADFGVDFWRFLHNLNVSNNQVVQEVTTCIAQHCFCANQFKWDVTCDFLKGTVNDIILVHINIYENKDDSAAFLRTVDVQLT